MNSDAIAICVLPRRRDDRPYRNILELADSPERITNLSPLNRKLMFIANVLVSASPAPAEIWALWFHTIRRSFLDLNQIRFGELLFFAHDFSGNELALDKCTEQRRPCPVLARRLFRRKRRLSILSSTLRISLTPCFSWVALPTKRCEPRGNVQHNLAKATC